MWRRRPSRRTISGTLQEVALAQPPSFDPRRVVGGFHQTLALEPLHVTPASMVLDVMGVHTAEDLLRVFRGVAGVAAVNALTYTLGLYDTDSDDVVSTVVLVADDTVPFPHSLT